MSRLLEVILMMLLAVVNSNVEAALIDEAITVEREIAGKDARQEFLDGAKAVIEAYRKLQSKIEAGANYGDFQKAYQDAEKELAAFKNSPGGRYKDTKYDNFWSGLALANQSYANAETFWRMSIFKLNDRRLKKEAITHVEESWVMAKDEVDKATASLSQ